MLGDAYGAGIVYHLNREALRKQDECEAALAIEDHDVIVEENGHQTLGKTESKVPEQNA